MTDEEKIFQLIKTCYQPVEDKPGYVWFSKRSMQIISIENLKAAIEKIIVRIK